MYALPRWPNLNVITPFHIDSMGGVRPGSQAPLQTATSGTIGGANVVNYHPFIMYEEAIAVKISYLIGGTSNGNVDVGIYDNNKNRLVNSGSTGQGTINTLQTLDITDTRLGIGKYYMAITLSSGTGTTFRVAQTDESTLGLFPCYVETTGGFGLPTTATFSISTNATPFINVMGVHFNTLV